MKKIKVTIGKDGTQKVEVLGAVGESCVEFTKELEQRLGVLVGERVFKPECNETVQETERQREVER